MLPLEMFTTSNPKRFADDLERQLDLMKLEPKAHNVLAVPNIAGIVIGLRIACGDDPKEILNFQSAAAKKAADFLVKYLKSLVS